MVIVHFPRTFVAIGDQPAETELQVAPPGDHDAFTTWSYHLTAHKNERNVTLTLEATAAASIHIGWTIRFNVSRIQNMQHVGSTGVWPVVRTAISNGSSIDEASQFYNPGARAPSLAIGPGPFLVAPRIAPQEARAGARTTLELNFTGSNPWPADGMVQLVLPGVTTRRNTSDFTHVVSQSAVTSPDGSVDGVLSARSWFDGANWNMTILRNGNGTAIAAGSPVWLAISGVTNPEESGELGEYPLVRTLLAHSGATIDEASAEVNSPDRPSGTFIIPGKLNDTAFESEFQMVEGQGYVDVAFRLDNPLPLDGRIELVFPVNYTISAATEVHDHGGTLEAAFTAASQSADWAVSVPSATHLNLTLLGTSISDTAGLRDGYSVAKGTRLVLRITIVTNPSHTDAASVMPLARTATRAGQVIDEASAAYHSDSRADTPSIRGLPRIDSLIADGAGGTMATSGGDTITINGEYFDRYASASTNVTYVHVYRFTSRTPVLTSRSLITVPLSNHSYGPTGYEYNATACRIVTESTVITCQASQGVGASLVFRVTVGGGQWSKISSATLSYTAPSIHALNGTAAHRDTSALPTVGGTVVTVEGDNFGSLHTTVSAHYSNPLLSDLAGTNFSSADCSVTIAHTTVQCTTREGVGWGHAWTITVADWAKPHHQTSAVSTSTTSYARANVSELAIVGDGESAATLETDGSLFVIVRGRDFGPRSGRGAHGANPVSAEYHNPLASQTELGGAVYRVSCNVTVPHVEMRCKTTPGVGYAQRWNLTVGEQEGPRSLVYTSYTPALVSAVSPASLISPGMRTSGGDVITISGMNFGPVTNIHLAPNVVSAVYQAAAWRGWTSAELAGKALAARRCNVTVNHTEMQCYSAPGVGHHQLWKLSVGAQPSTSLTNPFTSYRAPAIDWIDVRGALNTSGGEEVTLVGTDFGPLRGDNRIAANYSNSNLVVTSPFAGSNFRARHCNVTVAHVRVICESVEGVGFDQAWSITVGHQAHNSPQTTSYEAPHILQTTPSVAAFTTQGGESMTLTGRNFGPVLADNVVASWYLNEASYNLAGEQFDAVDCHVTVAHAQIVCTTIVGVGFEQTWRVQVGAQTSTPSVGWTSYALPQITAIDSDETHVHRLATEGSQTIILSGSEFGPVSNDNTVLAAFTTTNIDAQDLASKTHNVHCNVTVAHQQIKCPTAVGVGSNFTWRVTVGEQRGNASVATTSYARPLVLGFDKNARRLSTQGGEPVTITGTNFGPVTAPGAAYENSIFAEYRAYERPTPVASGGSDATDGSLLARRTFGPGVDLAGSVFTATFCNVTVDHTEIVCVSAEGVGAYFRWSLSVGGQWGNTAAAPPDAFASYDPPRVDTILSAAMGGGTCCDFNTAGGEVVVLRGVNLGPAMPSNSVNASYVNRDLTRSSTLGGSVFSAAACNVTVAHEEMRCRTIPGVGYDHRWTATVGHQDSNASDATSSYRRPRIDQLQNGSRALDLSALSTEGGEVVRVLGRGFGPPDDRNDVAADYQNPSLLHLAGMPHNTTCTVVSDTLAECAVVAGVGHGQRWRLSVGGQWSPRSAQNTTYSAPSISESWQVDDDSETLSADGGESITISGTNLGPKDDRNVVHAMYQQRASNRFATQLESMRFVAHGCAVTTAHAVMTCTTVPAVGVGHAWRVVVGAQVSRASTGETSVTRPTFTTGSSFYGILGTASTRQQYTSDSERYGMATAGNETVPFQADNLGPDSVYNLASATYWFDPQPNEPTIAQVCNGRAAGCLATANYTSPACAVRYTLAEALDGLDDDATLLYCTTAPGCGAHFSWRVAVGRQWSDSSYEAQEARTKYVAPKVIELLPTAAALSMRPAAGAPSSLSSERTSDRRPRRRASGCFSGCPAQRRHRR